jgi:Na+-transporting methylmalonyl-CoA/oxaloacetate decarboxylase gamma subunit
MENIGFGLTVTLIGMGLVFALLGLLWALLAVMGKLDTAPPEPEEALAVDAPSVAPPLSSVFARAAAIGLDPEAVAAITIAVVVHTEVRRRQAAPSMRSTWPGSQIYASRWLAAGRTRQTRNWQRNR